jgi:hypothetical protein
VDFVALTSRVAPSGTPKVLLTNGIPGVPGAPGTSVFGMASRVQVLPPPVSDTKLSSGIWICSRIPFSSLFNTFVCALVRVLGLMPPPQRLVRLLTSRLRLAWSDAGPSAARRLRARLPPRGRVLPRMWRKRARFRTATQGFFLNVRRAWRAALRS